jgi:hypothetical protein
VIATQPQYPIPPVPPSITWLSNVGELGFPENQVPVRRPAGLSRVTDRTFNHQIAVLRLKAEFSSTYHSEAEGTGGMEATSVEGRITRAKKFSQRNSVISGPRPTGNALGH